MVIIYNVQGTFPYSIWYIKSTGKPFKSVCFQFLWMIPFWSYNILWSCIFIYICIHQSWCFSYFHYFPRRSSNPTSSMIWDYTTVCIERDIALLCHPMWTKRKWVPQALRIIYQCIPRIYFHWYIILSACGTHFLFVRLGRQRRAISLSIHTVV